MNALSSLRTGLSSKLFHLKQSPVARIIGFAAASVFAVGQLCAQVTLTTIHSFHGSDGSYPRAGLLRASDGYFYGTTSQGGTGVSGPAGTVFRIGSDGSFTNLISFAFQVTGDTPYGGVIEGSDGYLYGTTRGTGSYDGNIYRIARDGSSFTNLHTLLGAFFGSDGAHPQCNLLEVGDGYLYGTTIDNAAGGSGIVFRITPSGSIYTNLETIPGSSTAGLTLGGDGNIYGVTSAKVFRVTSSNTALATYTFNTTPDGNSPFAALVKGADGNLYGVATIGGANGNGTVFRITGGNSLSNLHSFDNTVDGYGPLGTLVLGSDGNFYGTTPNGGTNGAGTIFRISPGGAFATLYSFGYSTVDGYSPDAALVQGSDGSFYGTTFSGGTNNLGTVFKFTVPLGSQANQIPAFGLNGTNAVITITTIAGSKYQLQSSTSMTSSWSNAGSPIVGIGGPQTVTNSSPVLPGGKFYRFQITP